MRRSGLFLRVFSLACCFLITWSFLQAILGCLVMNLLQSVFGNSRTGSLVRNTLFMIHRIFIFCMRFSRYVLADNCFISHLKPNDASSDLKSLVKPAIFKWISQQHFPADRVNISFNTRRGVHPTVIRICLYLYSNRLPCFLLFILAATCSPTPSPVQYHRPLRS